VWHADGQHDPKPTSAAPGLEASIVELTGEINACDLERERILRERAEHVGKYRGTMAADVAKERAAVRERYERLIGELEAARAELLDVRACEVWVSLFPHDSLQSQPPFTMNLAVGRREPYERTMPGLLRGALAASSVFALLREDARACASVATAEQAAAIQGVSEAALTRKQAMWAGSEEDREREKREKQELREAHRRVWGHDPAEYK
jgi:hypothetical protein